MRQYRKNRISCPEETLFYIGNRSKHVEPELLTEVLKEYIAWQKERFPQVHVLDWSLHCDEEGAPHIHIRQVYVAYDKDGVAFVNQEAALTQMGVEQSRGKFTKDKDGKLIEKDRYNNRKATFTKACREKLHELALAHGLEIETAPRERREQGRSLYAYQAAQDRKAAEAANAAADAKLKAVRAARALVDEAHNQQALIAASTEIMKAVDASLKRFSLKNLNSGTARKAATEVLAILQPMQKSVDLLCSRLAAADDFGDVVSTMREHLNTRIRRVRGACRRALDDTKKRAKEEVARAKADADSYRQRRICEANGLLAAAAQRAAELDAREKALDAEADRKARERVRGYMDKLRDDERDLQSQIAVHKGSITTLEGEIKTLTTKKTALESEINCAEQQITPLMKALTAHQNVEDLLRAAAVLNQVKNARAHDGASVEGTIMRELDAHAQRRRSHSPSYDN